MLGTAAVLLLLYFTGWYLAAAALRNASIVDIGWGAGFVVLAVFFWLRGPTPAGLLVVVPVLFWGVRLAWHIGRRNWGKPEDFRYAAFRRDWGRTYAVRSFFQLFLFQGLLMLVISLPFLNALARQAGADSFPDAAWTPVAALPPVAAAPIAAGLLVWIGGFLLEAAADAQLRRFTANPANRGTFIRTGVWRFSRHPNYLGEAILWWGIWLISIGLGATWLTVAGPLVISLMIRWVSGVPMLERKWATRPGYAEYAREVPVFIPWRLPGKQGRIL